MPELQRSVVLLKIGAPFEPRYFSLTRAFQIRTSSSHPVTLPIDQPWTTYSLDYLLIYDTQSLLSISLGAKAQMNPEGHFLHN